MHKVYLSIGSNLGEKKNNLQEAIAKLNDHHNIEVIKISSFYETEPIGYTNQDWFLNIVLLINTTLDSYTLLDYCQYVEIQLKRERLIRWGPRTIDVDILLFDDVINKDERLSIPHPRMRERAFVMIPLYEIAPHLCIQGEPIEKIISNFTEQKIKKIIE